MVRCPQDKGMKKIIIYRQDLLGMLASWSAAIQSKADNAWWGHRVLDPIRIDPEWAVEAATSVLNYYASLMKGLGKQEYAVVTYEELTADYEGTMNQLTYWLGVGAGHSFTPESNKQMVNPIEDTVINIHEVEQALSAHGLPTVFSYDDNPFVAHRPASSSSSASEHTHHMIKRRHHGGSSP